MLTENSCIVSGLIFLCITWTFADSIKSYYIQDDEDCSSKAKKLICEEKCGINHACLYGRCICLKTESFHDEIPHFQGDSKDDRFSDFDDYTEITPLLHSKNKEEDEGRPALRHHIAHFCPNLEDARKCIRKCMQLGKPAFCGKDHVCYCGHKYDKPETTGKVNARDQYAQFHDMYKKYFGANDGSEETVEEQLERGKQVLIDRGDEEEE